MYKCNCGKEFEKKSSLTTHARFCILYEKEEKKCLEEYRCDCGREFEKAQSLNVHYSHCLIHRNGVPEIRRGGWKITDEVREKQAKTFSENVKNGKTIPYWKGKHHSVESKEKMSEAKIKSYIDNTFHCKFFIVNNGERDIKVQGTYERDFANFLNENGIKWDRKRLRYGDSHAYTPDFYISEKNIFIEVKGWMMDRDKEKYRRFFKERNETVYCCFKNDMEKLFVKEIEFEQLPLLKDIIGLVVE